MEYKQTELQNIDDKTGPPFDGFMINTEQICIYIEIK